MLNRIFTVLILALVTSVLSGCVYSKVTRPLDRDVNETRLGSKVGRASSKGVAYLVAWGDSGVAAAARNGGLSQVNHLDVESYILLFGLYTEVTTIAYGE